MKKILLAALGLLLAIPAYASVDELIENVKQNNVPAVVRLLAGGEDVNAVNENGNTALHYAVALDNADMVKVLLARGADLTIQNAKGWTPLLIAEKKQLPNVAPILQEVLQKYEELQSAAKTESQENVAAEKETTAVESVISQEEIAAYKKLVERAKQEILSARQERDALAAKNKVLEDEITRLKEEASQVQEKEAIRTKQAGDVAKKSETVAQKADTKSAPQAKSANSGKAIAKKVPVAKILPSKVIPQINGGGEEVVYCLHYLGQGENPNMVQAAGYYAASVGINQARYNQISAMASSFFATAGTDALKKRSNDCGKIITPANAEQQNKIIRSLNRAIRY